MRQAIARLIHVTRKQLQVPSPRATSLDFLMSGEPAVVASITALAARGFEGVQQTFNAHSPWPSLHRLRVRAGQSPGAARVISKTVLRVDPGAVRI
jgi:hypothetical protein